MLHDPAWLAGGGGPGDAPPRPLARRWRAEQAEEIFQPQAGKDHGAQRSGPRPGNEVFALLDRTGTGHLSWRWCLDRLCPPSVAFPSFPRWPYCCVGSFALRSIGGQLPHTVADWLGPGTSGNTDRFLATSTRKVGQGTRQRKQRSCADSFCAFPFLGEGGRDPFLLLPGPSFCLLAERRRRAHPLEAGCGRFALALARRQAPAGRSRAARRAAASGLRRWPIYDNAVFLPRARTTARRPYGE